MIESKINEAIEAINRLTESFDRFTESFDRSAPEEEPRPEPSLADLQSILGTLANEGMIDQVRSLIASYGASKLSEVPKDKYGDMMRRIEEEF